ncbi:MAG: hypothetical protein ABW123_13430 [Cystobacter sp.]
MPRTRVSFSAALVLGAVLSLLPGCEPVDLGDFGDTPDPLSNRVCYRDADCMGNACCGEGSRPTHVQDGPNCAGVRCDGTCPGDGLDCGRCVVICRESRCSAACQG